jgi:hypothetical protein
MSARRSSARARGSEPSLIDAMRGDLTVLGLQPGEIVVDSFAGGGGAEGFTADNLRRAAVHAGVITGEEGKGHDADRQRALSWFGPFLTTLVRRGRLAPRTYPDGQPVRRASDRPEAHGNKHIVYVLPTFARVNS